MNVSGFDNMNISLRKLKYHNNNIFIIYYLKSFLGKVYFFFFLISEPKFRLL